MKLHASDSRSKSGSILIVTLCSMMIIGLALLTYLTLGKNQNQLVFRSQVWNACLPIAGSRHGGCAQPLRMELYKLGFQWLGSLGDQQLLPVPYNQLGLVPCPHCHEQCRLKPGNNHLNRLFSHARKSGLREAHNTGKSFQFARLQICHDVEA